MIRERTAMTASVGSLTNETVTSEKWAAVPDSRTRSGAAAMQYQRNQRDDRKAGKTDEMHHDGSSPTLSNDSRTAPAVVRSISSDRGPHLQGACGRDLVSTRKIRRGLWRAGGADHRRVQFCGLAITSIRS